MEHAGLLADLAVMMAASPENVATRALDLLLSRSQAANDAINRLLTTWNTGAAGAPVCRWASQVVGPDQSRTDLEGFTESDETDAVLENKFWAGLTDNQPAGYLQRLKSSVATLVFVVPESRVRVLAHEIALRLGALYDASVNEARSGAAAILTRPSAPTVVVTSWNIVLETVGAAMEAAGEYENHADLRQLRGLTVRMETQGFRPFRQSDLTGDTPRLLLWLGGLVDEVVQVLLASPYANKKGLKASAALGWYGHYIHIHGYGCMISVTAHRWVRHGISPLWLRISSGKWKFPPQLGAPLRAAAVNAEWVFDEHRSGPGYWIALRVLENRERDAVVADLIAQVQRYAAVLGSHPERETDALPPEGG